MAQRIETFTVECPAGTLRSRPVEVSVAFNPGVVERVEIVIPDGHAGLTGLALANSHQIVIPYTKREFVIGNGETIPWPLEGFTDSGAWSAFVYNEDVYAHRWFLRFLIAEIAAIGLVAQPTAAPVVPVIESPVVEVPTQPGLEPPTGTVTEEPTQTPSPGEPRPGEPTAPEPSSPEPELPPAVDRELAEIPLEPLADNPMPPEIAEPPDTANASEVRAALHACQQRNAQLTRELHTYKAQYARLHGQVKRAKQRHGVPMHGHRQGQHGGPGHGGGHHGGGAPLPHAPNYLSGHPEVHSGVAHIAALIMAEFHDVVVSSTTGGVHAAGSYHYRGEAVDLIAPTAARMNEVGAWVARELGPHLTEGIHNSTLSIKNGRQVPPSFWGPTVWSEHLNHIHVAVDQGFSAPAVGGHTAAAGVGGGRAHQHGVHPQHTMGHGGGGGGNVTGRETAHPGIHTLTFTQHHEHGGGTPAHHEPAHRPGRKHGKA